MEHIMWLNPSPFQMIKDGTKTIELRLYDEKRQKIQVGDTICFINTSNESNILRTIVEKIYIFKSFEELYQHLPLLACGYTESNINTASPEDMMEYYPLEKQKCYGVIGIQIALV